MLTTLHSFCVVSLTIVAMTSCRSPSTQEQVARQEPASSPRDAGSDFEACLDRELANAGLNHFGDPPDTMYAGGSPLFNERTGETLSRREYVSRRHPEIVRKCQ
jgi:hypothetical protein